MYYIVAMLYAILCEQCWKLCYFSVSVAVFGATFYAGLFVRDLVVTLAVVFFGYVLRFLCLLAVYVAFLCCTLLRCVLLCVSVLSLGRVVYGVRCMVCKQFLT